jgi:subtilisin family serine protease
MNIDYKVNVTAWKILSALLVLLISTFSTETLAQDNIDNQIVVMFEPSIVSLPEGRDRTNPDEANLPNSLRRLLRAFDTQEIAKGIPEFRRSDTLRVLPDGRIFKVPDYTNLFVITLPMGMKRESLVDSLKQLPGIISAENNQKAVLRETIPNDSHFSTRQWNLKNTGQFGGTPGADIKATFAWDIAKGSSSVILGIIDTGIQSGHVDLQGKVSGDAGYSISHGTHVAGIAAANTNNSQGVAGVDWNARLVSQRMDLGGTPEIAQAINDAVAAGARVLNNSWGGPEYSSVLYNAFLSAYQADVLLTVANPEDGATGEFPNSFGPWIVNVGATTNGDAKTSYSFDRDYTDVGAPGGNGDAVLERDIYSTIPFVYGYSAGTSMATPHVTGIAGLLLSINPSLHNYDLEWIIKRSANDILPAGRDPSTGYGRVNAFEAVRHVAAPYQITHGNATLTKTNSNIQVTFLSKPLPELAAGVYVVDRWKLEAVVNFNPIYSQVPWAWLSQVGYSAANPNDAKEYMYENSTINSTTLRAYFYYLKTGVG